MTDYVLMGLLVAIVIVGVLLLSCWKTKPKRRRRDGFNSPGVFVAGVTETTGETERTGGALRGKMGEELGSGGTSESGSGVANSNAQNRSNVVANDLKGYDSWADVTAFMSLGGVPDKNVDGYTDQPYVSSVYESHRDYIQNMNHTTSTASMQSERDDLGGLPNVYVGLQRPNFTDHPGIEASARQDSSFTPDQMPTYRHYVL